MPIDWSQLQIYHCPVCTKPLKENNDGTMHLCTNSSCKFKISEERITQMVVLRYRKLDPPQFIKEMQDKDKKVNF